MKIHVRTGDPLTYASPLLAVPVALFSEKPPKELEVLDKATGGQLKSSGADFNGSAGTSLLCYAPDAGGRILFLGTGAKGVPTADQLR